MGSPVQQTENSSAAEMKTKSSLSEAAIVTVDRRQENESCAKHHWATTKAVVTAFLLCSIIIVTGLGAPHALQISTTRQVHVCSTQNTEDSNLACSDAKIDLLVDHTYAQDNHYAELSLALVKPGNNTKVDPQVAGNGNYRLAIWGIPNGMPGHQENGTLLEMPATASKEDDFEQETIELDASVAIRAYDCAAEQGEQKAGLLAEVELSESDHACVPAHVISLNLARYPAYRILITFEDDWSLNFASEATGPQDPQVFALLFLEHISKDFATFEIVFKYALFFAGILVLALFVSLLRKATAISLDQKWVAMLCVELISFNDPLCALDDTVRNNLFACLQAVGVVSFLSMLGLFWIFAPLRAHDRARFAEKKKSGPSARRDAKVFNVAAAALSMTTHKVPRSRYADGHWETSLPPTPAHDSPPDGFSSLTFTQRHWIKLCVCTLIWLAVSVAKALEAVKRYQDPLVNPSQAVSVDWFLEATTACMILSILAWGLATVLHGALLFQSMQACQLSHLALNVGLLVFLLVRTVLHAHDAEINRGRDMVFVHGFLSTYIWFLALLFAPPVASANLASADGAANDLDTIGPVSPVPVRIVRTTSEVDRLYTRRVSEESAPNSYFTRVNSLDEDDEAHVAEIHEHIYIEPADPEADGGPTWTMRRCYPV